MRDGCENNNNNTLFKKIQGQKKKKMVYVMVSKAQLLHTGNKTNFSQGVG